METKVSRLQWIGWVYAALFAGVVILGHLPGVNDSEGRLLGLFHITIYQDLLHGASGLWAAVAAWHSAKQVTLYFKWFGTIYFLDGVVGAILGRTFLDLGIFTGAAAISDPTTRILANLPHVVIGGAAMVIGFALARRWTPAR